MNQWDTLRLHQELCDEVYQCVLEENRSLSLDSTRPYPDLIEKKRALLARLDKNLESLRTLPAVSSRDGEALAQLDKARSRILQILQMDKENERLMLRASAGGVPPGAQAPSSALLKKIYSRSS
jgi:flagellar biosynthesis/type III secretory pathway chaperone